MPTYEYRCKDCGHDFETVQSFTDDALTECPNCHGALRKVFGNVGISFKGSGFYKTDSRSPAKAKEGSESSSDGKGDSKGSDTKVAASGGSDSGGSSDGGSSSKADSGGSSDKGTKSDNGGSSDKGASSDKGTKAAGKAKEASGSSSGRSS